MTNWQKIVEEPRNLKKILTMWSSRTSSLFSSPNAIYAVSSLLVVTIWLLAAQTVAQKKIQVDMALVLAVDCSHSVSNLEFDLQMQGMAKAFSSREVIAAIGNNKIAVTLVQWSGSENQVVSVQWTIVENNSSARQLASTIRAAKRLALGKTSISAAIDFSNSQIAKSPYIARRKVIDISADGVNNDGVGAKSARNRAIAAGMIINGLVILNDVPNLDRYFEQFIVGGPGNFVIKANTYDDYADAIKRKLLREISSLVIS
jgi:hypothetical protein